MKKLSVKKHILPFLKTQDPDKVWDLANMYT